MGTVRTTRPEEILVIGAGPTGLALALQAYAYGAHVGVVEWRHPSHGVGRWAAYEPWLDHLSGCDPLVTPGAADVTAM